MNFYFTKSCKGRYFDFCLMPNIRLERAVNRTNDTYFTVTLEWLCFAVMLTIGIDDFDK